MARPHHPQKSVLAKWGRMQIFFEWGRTDLTGFLPRGPCQGTACTLRNTWFQGTSVGFQADFNRTWTGFHAQRALRDILMSRGKNCLPIVSRQFLTRNYPRPNRLLKCLPNCLSPTGEGIFSSFKITPAVRVIARQLRDKNCPGAIFAPGHQDVSQGPLGGIWLPSGQKMLDPPLGQPHLPGAEKRSHGS